MGVVLLLPIDMLQVVSKFGRLFPEDGVGPQSFRFDIRNPLIQKHYWDTDIENCHYCIAN